MTEAFSEYFASVFTIEMYPAFLQQHPCCTVVMKMDWVTFTFGKC